MIIFSAIAVGILYVTVSLTKPLHSPLRQGLKSIKDSDMEFPVPVSVTLVVCLGIVVLTYPSPRTRF